MGARRRAMVSVGLGAMVLVAIACSPTPGTPASTTTTSTSTTTSSTSTTTTTTTTLPALPATALRFVSDAGDFIGQGRTTTWTPSDGTFRVAGGGSLVSVDFDGGSSANWSLDFSAPIGAQIAPGAFEGATRYPFESPTGPGLSISGSGRGCNTLTGRFDVLELATDANGVLTRFAADFEQHCEGKVAALRGSIRWNSLLPATDTADADADGVVDQQDNCRSVANADQVDSDGNEVGDACDAGTYLRFRSDKGDYIGQSLTRTWFPADGTFVASRTYGDTSNVQINFNGGTSANWSLIFNTPAEVLTPGTYTGATRFPFQSPTKPGLSVSGSGRGCNTLTGTFTVHEAVYNADNSVARFSADFEQHCEGKAAALRGSVRYQASPPA